MNYQNYFGLKEPPFRITPDPAFFFPSNAHREALQTLLYSIRAGEGFVQITGDPGTGKTLLIRTILKELGDDYNAAFVFNPRLAPHELLRTLLEDLGQKPSQITDLPREGLLRRFRDILQGQAARGRKVLVIIDEAQNLPQDTLEELRLLSNLETEKEKLLQTILVGQRELEAKLERPEVRQLHQRITIRYCLQFLTRGELTGYIYHRLGVAAHDDQEPQVQFSSGALRSIYRNSQGIPRLVNILCERCLMAVFIAGRREVRTGDVRQALKSIMGNNPVRKDGFRQRSLVPALVVLILVSAIIITGLTGLWRPSLPWTFWTAGSRDTAVSDAPPARAPVGQIDQARARPFLEAPADASPADLPVSIETAGAPASLLQADLLNQPPPEVIAMAAEALLVRVILDTGLLQIWRGTATAPELVTSQTCNWPYGEGLFLVGRDSARGGFIFNHAALMRGSPTSLQSSPFFSDIQTWISGNAVPLVASRMDQQTRPTSLEAAREVKTVFRQFIHHWENRQLTQLFDFYGDLITFHQIDQDQPTIQTAQQAYQRRQELFRRSGPITVGVSQPVFILDPLNPANIMAVYQQHYASRIWQDIGTKILHFNLQGLSQDPAWRVVAEFWVADQ